MEGFELGKLVTVYEKMYNDNVSKLIIKKHKL